MTTSEARAKFLDSTVTVDGDTWKVIAVGAVRDDSVYCHLASTTRSRKQRNGDNPIQACDFVSFDDLEAAA